MILSNIIKKIIDMKMFEVVKNEKYWQKSIRRSDDIIQLIEKKNALPNLALLLEKNEGKKELLKECHAEKDMVYKQYQKWWHFILNKYKYITIDELFM